MGIVAMLDLFVRRWRYGIVWCVAILSALMLPLGQYQIPWNPWTIALTTTGAAEMGVLLPGLALLWFRRRQRTIVCGALLGLMLGNAALAFAAGDANVWGVFSL